MSSGSLEPVGSQLKDQFELIASESLTALVVKGGTGTRALRDKPW